MNLTKKALNFVRTLHKPHKKYVDPFEDLTWYFSVKDSPIFFDVGANIGQSALEYNAMFPNSKIFSFEPFPTTFQTLKANVKHLGGIQIHPFGFGNSEEVIRAPEKKNSDMNTVVEGNWRNNPNQFVDVQIETIDRFILESKINRVDFLKIDTEGFEIQVLEGAENALKDGLFSFIQVEVGMNNKNSYHTDFESVKKKLERFNYYLFKVYNQVHEWPTKKKFLRRCDLVFIHESVA